MEFYNRYFRLRRSSSAFNMKQLLLVTLTLLFASQVQGQEQWTYTEFHPWYWLPSDDVWIYASNQPQYVWSDDASDWVSNPMSVTPAFDVAEVAEQSPLVIELQGAEMQSMQLTLNLSGPSGGLLQLGEANSAISYRYNVDSVSGSLLLFGQLDTDAARAFSLLLRFDTPASGSYTLLGDLGFSSCRVCEFTGSFNLLN